MKLLQKWVDSDWHLLPSYRGISVTLYPSVSIEKQKMGYVFVTLLEVTAHEN
jgi:hypothetical protein